MKKKLDCRDCIYFKKMDVFRCLHKIGFGGIITALVPCEFFKKKK